MIPASVTPWSASRITLTERPRPDRMFRRGRPVRPEFPPDELLFRACPPDAAPAPDGRPNPAAFRLPELSVNRSSLSEPEDCRYPDRHSCLVLAFPAGRVPASVKADGPTGHRYNLGVVHDPENDNYGHSLVRIWKESGEPIVEQNGVPKTVKMKVRQALADASHVAAWPATNLDDQGA